MEVKLVRFVVLNEEKLSEFGFTVLKIFKNILTNYFQYVEIHVGFWVGLFFASEILIDLSSDIVEILSPFDDLHTEPSIDVCES